LSSLVHHPLYLLGVIYLIILVLRAALSWFPVQPGTDLAKVNHWLYVVTEPFLAPFRKVIPPMGMFDISYLVALLVMWLVTTYLLARVVV
jgi:YggT family protein